MFKFHVPVKTERAVAVGSSALLASVNIIFGIGWDVPVLYNHIALVSPNPKNHNNNRCEQIDQAFGCAPQRRKRTYHPHAKSSHRNANQNPRTPVISVFAGTNWTPKATLGNLRQNYLLAALWTVVFEGFGAHTLANDPSSATATGGWAGNGIMIIEFSCLGQNGSDSGCWLQRFVRRLHFVIDDQNQHR